MACVSLFEAGPALCEALPILQNLRRQYASVQKRSQVSRSLKASWPLLSKRSCHWLADKAKATIRDPLPPNGNDRKRENLRVRCALSVANVKASFMRYLVAFITLVMLTSIGCQRMRTPFNTRPGNIRQQRFEAVAHDPYPQDDLGPTTHGARPRDYQKPVAEPVRDKMYAEKRYWFRN